MANEQEVPDASMIVMQLTNKVQLEERMKLAIEATGIGTWDYDPNTRFASYDEQCKRLFGFTKDTVVTYEKFLANIEPTDRLIRNEILGRSLAGENNGKYETQ